MTDLPEMAPFKSSPDSVQYGQVTDIYVRKNVVKYGIYVSKSVVKHRIYVSKSVVNDGIYVQKNVAIYHIYVLIFVLL